MVNATDQRSSHTAPVREQEISSSMRAVLGAVSLHHIAWVAVPPTGPQRETLLRLCAARQRLPHRALQPHVIDLSGQSLLASSVPHAVLSTLTLILCPLLSAGRSVLQFQAQAFCPDGCNPDGALGQYV